MFIGVINASCPALLDIVGNHHNKLFASAAIVWIIKARSVLVVIVGISSRCVFI